MLFRKLSVCCSAFVGVVDFRDQENGQVGEQDKHICTGSKVCKRKSGLTLIFNSEVEDGIGMT